MNDEMDEIIDEFLVESYENLDRLEQAFVSLEQHADPDTVAEIFRTVHTIKGTAGFLGFSVLESLTHVGENLLSKLRDGALDMTTEIASALLDMIDAVREVLASVKATGAESSTDYSALVAELSRLDRGEPAPAADADADAAAADADADADAAQPEADGEPEAVADVIPIPQHVAEPDVADTEPAPRIGEQLVDAGSAAESDVAAALETQNAGDPRHVGEILVENEAVESKDVVEALLEQEARRDERPAGSETIRVDVALLDELMKSVGELVLARNQILQFTETQSDPTFVATSQRLNLITSELQESVMQTRMQPIENVWNKFPRVVRDLTQSCGKRARLDMTGKHTELDKTLLEAIRDPLTHLVRNSVDHGLETVEDRLAAGKPEEGVVSLTARHEGGQVVVEISDDGAGIDPAIIRRKAVEKGLLTSDEAAMRSDRDIVNMIFEPGFSTAAQVTNISGRGVGMDVVRTNIEGIGGSVDVQSVVGSGTTFVVKIPLTLAIIPALVVTCADERYAIPQASLNELVRVEPDEVEHIDGQLVYRLRGTLLPLVDLSVEFGLRTAGARTSDAAKNVVVLHADGRVFGVVVDEINDTAEIVVKPLGRFLQQASVFAGATIMGDGRVALIVDATGFADHVGIASDTSRSGRSALDEIDDNAAERQRLVLVRLGGRRFAVPLGIVARLEYFRSVDVEVANHRQAVQYGDQIMPLVRLGDELGVETTLPGPQLPTIVFAAGGRHVGLLVDEIVDIVEEVVDLSPDHTTGHGLLGSLIIDGAVSDVVDIHGVLSDALPELTREGAVA